MVERIHKGENIDLKSTFKELVIEGLRLFKEILTEIHHIKLCETGKILTILIESRTDTWLLYFY